MFAVWATKQVSGCCGVNHLLHYIDDTVVDKCPNCGSTPETVAHVVVCPDPACSMVFNESVTKLSIWMNQQRTDPALTALICEYLRGRGRRMMVSICGFFSKFTPLARIVDKLGWRNFLP